jgi:hypothetical protein
VRFPNAVLLILCLATTCAISSTFAKYTTSDSATDSARVAKWGVTVEVTGDDAFATEYTADKASSGNANAEVKSTVAVVAPGTEGDLAAITIAGTPEVAVNVKVVADVELANWTVDSTMYFPVVVKVNNTAVDVSAATDLAGVEAAIEDAIIKAALGTSVTPAADGTITTGRSANVNYAPQNNFGEAATVDVTVTWEWPFTTTGNDAKDTALGDAATATATEPTISCTVSVTVEQIDTYTAPTP